MKELKTSGVKYDSPRVESIEIETTAILCASSNELKNLTKNDEFEFNWEN